MHKIRRGRLSRMSAAGGQWYSGEGSPHLAFSLEKGAGK